MQYGFKLVPVTIKDVSWHLLPSKLRLTICCLLPAMYVISRCASISSFSHTGKITTFQTLKSKQKKLELTDMIDFGEFFSLSLESPSVATSIKYVCYFMMRINQVQVWMNYDVECLPKRIRSYIVYHQLSMLYSGGFVNVHSISFVLRLFLVVLFFHQYLFNIFSKYIKYNI